MTVRRLGVLVRYWPTLSETFVAREVAELQRRGVQVDVVALGSRADGALADRIPRVPVLRPPRLPVQALRPGRAVRWLVRQQGVRRALRALWVGQQARRRGWDRMHVHFAGEAAEWARVASRVAGIPYSVTVHAVDLFRPRPGLGVVLADAAPVVTVAASHRALIARDYGVDATVVRCGVEPERFAPCAPRGAGPLRIVTVARDVPKKGLDDLVAVLPAVPGARLRLVSDAHRLAGPRVVVGAVAPSRIPTILARSHVFALPCRVADDGDRDGVPVSLMEAMAAGLPVVTTSVAGIPELVDEHVGWLVPPGDPEALAEALREVAAFPAEAARRGRAGRRRVVDQRWTLEAQVDGLLDAWRAPGVATSALRPDVRPGVRSRSGE